MKAVTALILLAQVACAQTGCLALVVANTVDSQRAGGLYSLIASMGCDAVKADSRSYMMLKESPLIIILGGQMSPEGVGYIVSGLLSESEKEALLTPNASATYAMENVSAPGQKLIVFAGYNEDDTERAWRHGAEAAISPLLKKPRLILSAPTSLQITAVNNMLSYSFPVNVTNNGSDYAEVRAEAYLNGGVRLDVKPSAFNLTAGRSQRVMVSIHPKRITGGSSVAFTASGYRAETNISLAGSEKAPPCNCATRD